MIFGVMLITLGTQFALAVAIPLDPDLCAPLTSNDDTGGSTVSTGCLATTVTAGSISIEDLPGTFTFPSKYTSSFAQNSFSNDNPATGTIDVETAADDVLTVADLRNSGGFDVTITGSILTSGPNDIPLSNLYVATSCPDSGDLSADLYGSPTNCDATNGAEFADGSSATNNMDQTNTVYSANATGTGATSSQLTALVNGYTSDGKSFDANQDGAPDTIFLMQSTNAHVARISQTLGFYLNIPANQTSGTYNIKLTIDLIPG